MLERKKIKSLNPGVTESRSFLVRYRRTYVLNNIGALELLVIEYHTVGENIIGAPKTEIHSTKILLLPTKYEIIMVPSSHSCFQYGDSYIGLFFIDPCKFITLNPLCISFGISSLLLFLCLSL